MDKNQLKRKLRNVVLDEKAKVLQKAVFGEFKELFPDEWVPFNERDMSFFIEQRLDLLRCFLDRVELLKLEVDDTFMDILKSTEGDMQNE